MVKLVQITDEVIDSSYYASFLGESDGGAINIFLGTTRRFTRGRETVSLSYEAATDLAENEMGRVLEDAASRWTLKRAVIIHRTGLVPVHEGLLQPHATGLPGQRRGLLHPHVHAD